MAGSRDHLLAYPRAWMLTLRIVQLVGAIAILALMSFVVAFIAHDIADHEATAKDIAIMVFGLIVITITTKTIFITTFEIVAETCAPFMYNYWLILAFDIYAIVCWFIVFCVLLIARHNRNHDLIAAACGLAALEFMLFIVTVAFVDQYIRRHRKAGGHCAYQLTNDNVEVAGAPVVEREPEIGYQQSASINEAAPPVQAQGTGESHEERPVYA